jgi:hypothetical protein
MTDTTQKIFFTAAIVFLLALTASGQPGPGFKLITQHNVVFQGQNFPSSTSPQVDKAQNTLTFSGAEIRILALAGPEDAMLSYKIAGLTNPTLRVPAGSRIQLTVVNIDDDMYHDLVIWHPRGSFSVRPEIPPQALRTHSLKPRHGQTSQAEVLVLQAIQPGSYEYFCSTRGHAKGGMHGLLDVLPDSATKSHP